MKTNPNDGIVGRGFFFIKKGVQIPPVCFNKDLFWMWHWLECVGGGRVAQMHTVWRRSDCEKATAKTTDGLPFIYNEEANELR